MSKWMPIESAPKDGTPVQIRGWRFRGGRYTAVAVYTKRRCSPAECEGWFPPTDKHDGAGPYETPTHWRPIEEFEADMRLANPEEG